MSSPLAYDNRAVEPGTLFFCVPGFTRDGHEYAPDAVERGAVAVVVERPSGLGHPRVVVPTPARDGRRGRALRRPNRHARRVGITGTSGKTTTTHLIRAILLAAGGRAGCSAAWRR